MKQRIKLTESTLHRIVKESVKRILKEWGWEDIARSKQDAKERQNPANREKETERRKREDSEEMERYRHMWNARQACH